MAAAVSLSYESVRKLWRLNRAAARSAAALPLWINVLLKELALIQLSTMKKALVFLAALALTVPVSTVPSHAPRIRYKDGTSTNWSGYAVETNLTNPQNNAVSDVKGSWVIPTVTCGSTNTYSSAWVGIDGYADNSVEQTGTEQDCLNGSPSYYAWYEMYPKPSYRLNLAVKAGDNVSAEVRYLNNNTFQLILNNLTTGKSVSFTQKAKAQRQSAEWVMEAPWSGGVLPLSNFGAIQFSGAQATLNGHIGTISDSAWKNDQIDMVNSTGGLKATTSALSSGGSSFSVNWVSSN